ncbi:MAG: VCBS repeat-containing protein [Isosphaeraceae bacterium]
MTRPWRFLLVGAAVLVAAGLGLIFWPPAKTGDAPGVPAATPAQPAAKAVPVGASTSEAANAPVRIAFREGAAAAGLTTPHFDAADGRFRLVESMGGGVAMIDFDDDGWLDLFIAQGSPIPRSPDDQGLSCQLYRNNRDGTFTDVAKQSGIVFPGYAEGVAVADYDGDGREDLFVSGFNLSALFRNLGGGRFENVTARAGLEHGGWSSSCAFADLDGDGDPDLYVVRYLADTVDASGRPTVSCNALPGQVGYCPPLAFRPEPDSLYRNNGDGTFTDVSREAGISATDGNGLGLAVLDLDDDGKLDVFVANDKTPNRLYHNLGGLKFEEVGLEWGLAYNENGEAMAGMGVAAGDLDGDGRPDLVVTNFYEEGVTVYRNVAPGRFEIVTARARLRVPTRSKLGFGTGLLDLDNDGRLDLFITNGHVNDVRPVRMPYQMTPQVFWNEGGGRFADVSTTAGPYFQGEWLGRGAAFGDLDNDGDTDIVVTHNSAGRPCSGTSLPGAATRSASACRRRRGAVGREGRGPGRRSDDDPRSGRRDELLEPERPAVPDRPGRVDAGRQGRGAMALRQSRETWTDLPADRPVQLREGSAPAVTPRP